MPGLSAIIESPKEVKKVILEQIETMPERTKKEILEKYPELKIWQAPGCKFCGGKGTKGRIAIYEAMAMTPELEKIIVGSPTEAEIKSEAERQEMITMKQDGIIKVLEGLISFEELMSTVEN